MYPLTTPEEELKLKVAKDFFADKIYDTTRILGRIDFCVSLKEKPGGSAIHFIWGEAKKGRADIYASLVQLILTIGKEKTFANELPPVFLCAFDAEKIAFLPYHKIAPYFDKSGFNWQVTPSNHTTPEFKALYDESKALLESEKLLFIFKQDKDALKSFIKANLTLENDQISKLQITKDNFKHIYYKWLDAVAPHISIDWEAEKPDILSADFFLADLLSSDNITLKKTLRILLQSDFYKVKLEKRANSSSFNFTEFSFKDEGKAHKAFWRLYERPPKEDYWDYILERRDYLVPMDIRERKGAFFTPQLWVTKAQHYLSSALNSAFEDCVIWDCAAGTGNLLRGLPQKPACIYASTLDKADVEIMRELYGKEGALLENHIFEFDFLNDEFFDIVDNRGTVLKKSPLPQSLQDILRDEKKRQKLIIFINPPYAEAASAKQVTNTGSNKAQVARGNKVSQNYKDILGKANNELFAQFFIRIQQEIQGCILASFSTLKYVNSANFAEFRQTFKAEFKKGFVCPADTFDNVKGQFPIGFMIWDTSKKEQFKSFKADCFEADGAFIGTKKFTAYDDKNGFLNDWIRPLQKDSKNSLGFLTCNSNDFQTQNSIFIVSEKLNETSTYYKPINQQNLMYSCIYFAVRHAIDATWLNDRDQFLYPNDKWIKDAEFQNDCLAFTLFHSQNRISSKSHINHFIPFEESEIKAKESFKSDFMYRFLRGKIVCEKDKSGLFETKAEFIPTKPLEFSIEAKKVFEAGRKLWSYYHSQDFNDPQKPYNANASLYDIKAFFQGFNEKGKMNAPQKATDSHYKDLIGTLNLALKELALKITPKIYEYGFLRE